MRSKTIQYGIDQDTGMVISKVEQEVAIDVIEFEKGTPENNFEMPLNLEKHSIYTTLPHMNITWTRKIDIEEKNRHRAFWGFKPLKEKETSNLR